MQVSFAIGLRVALEFADFTFMSPLSSAALALKQNGLALLIINKSVAPLAD